MQPRQAVPRPSGALALALAVALTVALASWALAPRLSAQSSAPQTSADGYTRYVLLDPDDAAFRILYEVSATRSGATHYFNGIRAGAEEVVHGVTDPVTGDSLEWEVVDGAEARRTGHPTASLDGHFIRVRLARSVPEGGEGRVFIDKTYVDRQSYFRDGDELVFDRSLGVRRNSVALPEGYELAAVNHPSQVTVENGRVVVSFINDGAASVPYRVRARPLPTVAARDLAGGAGGAAESAEAAELARRSEAVARNVPATADFARPDFEWSERAHQTREIVYFPHQPETHAFRLYHDYTETRPGVDRYVNVVRAGSKASNPSARVLDTGEELEVVTLRGAEVAAAGVMAADQVEDATEVVLIRFPVVEPGGSVRLRIEETYTDEGRYLLAGSELLWDRNFGRPYNAVVLPPGWYLTHSAIPATVRTTADGRVRLDFTNPRPDGIQVFVKGRRRTPELGVRGTSWTGMPMLPRAPSPEEQRRLRLADAALERAPADPAAVIEATAAREAVWRYDEAIELYTRALEAQPDDWELLLRRAHRLMRLRSLEAAERDLDRARERDPDGFNTAYLGGLVRYFDGRFGEAADELLRCLERADAAAANPARGGDPRRCSAVRSDPASLVALTSWGARALLRARRGEEAETLLRSVPREFDDAALVGPRATYASSPIVPDDNRHYAALVHAYRGELDEDELLDREAWGGQWATVAYGMAALWTVQGRTAEAETLLEEIVADPNWARFGHVAAEADLMRLRGLPLR